MMSLSVVDLVMIVIGAPSFANLFDDCLGEGMIFEFWGKIVKGKFWMKPLGGCVICTNVWITIAFTVLILIEFNLPVLALSILGVSNTVLRFILK